jgi:hypothetical protein
MAADASKRNDSRLIVFATVIILAVGFALMGGLYLMLRATSGSASCSGSLVVGEVKGLRDNTKDSPILSSPGGRCEFWVAQHDGRLLAVKTTLPNGCRVDWNPQRDSFICNGALIAWRDVPTWPTREVRNTAGTTSMQIDFG